MPSPKFRTQQLQFMSRFFNGQTNDADEKRMARIKKNQEQQSVIFSDDFLEIPQERALETTRIGYDPLTGAPTASFPMAPPAQAAENTRSLSRHRIVHGPVDFYFGDELENPQTIHVMSTCAPNLMGTSPQDQEKFSTFSHTHQGKPVYTLNEEAYKAACEQQAEFIIKAAKDKNHDKLIMPAFGVGVYLNTLDPASKEKARAIMFEAFARASAKHQLPVEWVVWKDDKNADKLLHQQQEILQKLKSENIHPLIESKQGDIFQEIQKSAAKGEHVVLLNPGSDRTIGGKFYVEDPKTGEEQIAQCSDLLALQTDTNQSMVNRFNDEFRQRKEAKIASSPPPSTPSTQHSVLPHQTHHTSHKPQSQQFNFSSISDLYKQKLMSTIRKNEFIQISNVVAEELGCKKRDTPIISVQRGGFSITFKEPSNAQNFTRALADMGIKSHTGTIKQVQSFTINGHDFKGVFLTPKQYKDLNTMTQMSLTQAMRQSGSEISSRNRADCKSLSDFVSSSLNIQARGGFLTKEGGYQQTFASQVEAQRFLADCMKAGVPLESQKILRAPNGNDGGERWAVNLSKQGLEQLNYLKELQQVENTPRSRV